MHSPCEVSFLAKASAGKGELLAPLAVMLTMELTEFRHAVKKEVLGKS